MTGIAQARAANAPQRPPQPISASVSREEWEFLQEQDELGSAELFELNMQAQELDAFLPGNPAMAKLIDADKRGDVALLGCRNKIGSHRKAKSGLRAGRRYQGQGHLPRHRHREGWARAKRPSPKGKNAYFGVDRRAYDRPVTIFWPQMLALLPDRTSASI